MNLNMRQSVGSWFPSRRTQSFLLGLLVFLWIVYLRQGILHKIDMNIETNEVQVPDDVEEIEVEEVMVETEPIGEDEVDDEEDPTSSTDDENEVEVGSLTSIISIPSSGTVKGRMIQHPGVPRDAYRWKSDYSFIKSGLDLPRIYPASASNWNTTIPQKTQVCVFNRTPRQRSLWATDVLAMFGSGKYHYTSLEATDCQFFGTCRTAKESRKHEDCDPEISPTVGLVEWVKCCFHDRFANVMRTQAWDVAVATGDEYCASNDASNGRADFRFYYDGNDTKGGPPKGVYLPLGPREEFRRVKPKHIFLASERQYLFNFVGSLTSRSRKVLAGVLRRGITPSGMSSFLHIIGTWSKDPTRSNGYILPHEYRRVLLNSTFTLCPDGHNPEAYRIYEALEAGSIPILALDEYYVSHQCQHAFAPFIKSGAPLVYLNSWTGLKPFLATIQDKPELLVRMQADAMAWYSKWMRKKANVFERVMEERFNGRTGRTTDAGNV